MTINQALPCSSRGDIFAPRYARGMTSFTLDGQTFAYLRPDPGHPAEKTRSSEYGNYP
jgi:hypothetical protein